MMHALKWKDLHTRMFFKPEDGSGGGEPAPSSGGGDSGGAPPASAPGGGGEAAPAATPTPSPDATPAPTDWSSLGSADDLDYIAIPAQAAPGPEQTPQPQEVPPQPAPQPEPQPTPQPTPPQTPPAGAPGEARPLTASDPWRIAEGLEANRDAIVAHLAQAKFALSEDDIKALDTDVVAAVPRLLARVFLESQVSMQKFLAQAVPGMMKQYTTVSSANDRAEREFFDTHKALDINNPQHRAAAVRIATVYRQANPDIPLRQLIAEVGPMVMATLQVKAAAQPATRAQPSGRNAPAFVPAVNGGGGHSPAAEPENEWAGLGRNYD